MSDKDQQTVDDLKKIIDILEQRIHEIGCTGEPSFRYLTELLDAANQVLSQLE